MQFEVHRYKCQKPALSAGFFDTIYLTFYNELKPCSTFCFAYSVRKDSTGFAIAALIAWKLIVSNAITNAVKVVITNTAQLIFTR